MTLHPLCQSALEAYYSGEILAASVQYYCALVQSNSLPIITWIVGG